ncbi:MAG: rhodanese-like domain-containing protein [Desulfovibrionales bacterium]
MRPKHSLWLALIMIMALIAGGCSAKQGTGVQAGMEPAEALESAGETPDFFFHDIVGVEFVEQYAKIPQPEDVMLIDSRPYQPKFVQGYIPTAVSIPDSQFEKMTDKLPANKEALLVFYCEGPT